MQATYVSVWDGSVEIRTSCKIDLTKKPPFVSNIEVSDVNGIDSLDEEFVELEDGTIIDTFVTEDGLSVGDDDDD